ncbi:MAG: hypothetical protein WCR27_07800 [Eubacteriales bacterium]
MRIFSGSYVSNEYLKNWISKIRTSEILLVGIVVIFAVFICIYVVLIHPIYKENNYLSEKTVLNNEFEQHEKIVKNEWLSVLHNNDIPIKMDNIKNIFIEHNIEVVDIEIENFLFDSNSVVKDVSANIKLNGNWQNIIEALESIGQQGYISIENIDLNSGTNLVELKIYYI